MGNFPHYIPAGSLRGDHARMIQGRVPRPKAWPFAFGKSKALLWVESRNTPATVGGSLEPDSCVTTAPPPNIPENVPLWERLDFRCGHCARIRQLAVYGFAHRKWGSGARNNANEHCWRV